MMGLGLEAEGPSGVCLHKARLSTAETEVGQGPGWHTGTSSPMSSDLDTESRASAISKFHLGLPGHQRGIVVEVCE